MVDPRKPIPLLAVLLAIFAAGCSAKVKVESVRSATASDRGEDVESQTAEKARTEVQLDLLQNRAKPVADPLRAMPNKKGEGTTVIFNVHGGDVHVHDDQHKAATPKEADIKTPQGSFLNTKIGWPTAYSQHGPQAWAGALVVWLLAGTAVVLMLATVGRSSGGPLIEIIALLVAAAIVLQFLPDTDSGLQFIPISPWSYSGWLAFCLSVISWLSLITAILIALSRCSDAPAVFSAATLFAMGINLLLSFGG